MSEPHSLNTSALGKATTPILVISHPRAGNTLLLDFIRRHFPQSARKKAPLQKAESLILDIGAIWKNKMTEKKAIQRLNSLELPLIKMHGFDLPKLNQKCPDLLEEILAQSHILYVSRDIRPMLCSYHAYAKLFCKPARVPIAEFIRQEEPEASFPGISRIKYWEQEVLYWVNQPQVRLFTFEEIMANPVRQVERLAQILKVPAEIKHPLIPPKTETKWKGYLNRYLTILPESTSAPLGKSVPDWFEVFTDSDLEFIREEGAEALSLLGYMI